MLRTDTGNFNRLLTSLGLLAVAAAFLIPYFYFRDTDVLQMSRQELRALTPPARSSLETRQRRIGDLELPVAGVSVLLGAAGITFLLMGGRRLRATQEKEDAALDRRARRENYEIEQLSRDELGRKREEQVQEAVEVESAEAEEVAARARAGAEGPAAAVEAQEQEGGSSADGEQEGVAIDDDGLRVPPIPLITPAQARVEITRIEEAAKDALDEVDFDNFIFRASVKITPQPVGVRRLDERPRQVEIDGLFEAKGERPDVAMELKVTRLNVRSLQGRVRLFTDGTLALLSRYRQVTGRDVVGWLLIVVPREAPRLTGQERKNVEDYFERGLAGLARCTVMNEDEMEWAPVAFRRIFD